MIRHHGLVPVPVDIDRKTLGPKLPQLRAALQRPKAVVFMAAHIYGRRIDLRESLAALRERGIPLVEDCAESFGGVGFTGHEEAELSLFSFGGIKVSTAFGGGIATVRNAAVLREMRAIQSEYPVQSRWDYLKRILKYSAVAVPLNVPAVNAGVRRLSKPFGIDHKAYAVAMVRGFPDRLMERLREQPCGALLDVLQRQLAGYRMTQHQRQTEVGHFVETGLPADFTVPGGAALVKEYWLFPVEVENPEAVLAHLDRAGVDAYQGATQLALVEPPVGLEFYPEEAAAMMKNIIYLPVHRRVPIKDAQTLVKIVQKVGRTPAPPRHGRARL